MRRLWIIIILFAACGGPKQLAPDGGAPADAAPADAAPADAAPADAAPDAAGPPLSIPRLIAPLSTATVTQQRPTLRWVLGPGEGTPVVDLCSDRACTVPLSVTTQLAADNLSAVPAAALPAGWVYWRVRVVSGDRIESSATWQFWVGRSSASSSVDSSSGTILDVNGDGHADLLVGAPNAGVSGAGTSGMGAVHLYLGSATVSAASWNAASPARIDLPNIDSGSASFGISVASAGDVDGDGYADFLVGAYTANGSAGAAYLYLGSATPGAAGWYGTSHPRRIDLTDNLGPHFGVVVAGVGDVDGDGYGDFLVGSMAGDGAAYLYLGAAKPSAATWNGASARRIALVNPDGFLADFGFSLASAGDVNGDGHADFLVGAFNIPGIGGAAHLYLGSATPSAAGWNGATAPARIDLTNPDGQAAGFGYVASAGDVNGDGCPDFLVGAYNVGSGAGAAHLYLGTPGASAAAWNGAAPALRVDLTGPDGASAMFGRSVASAGDVNGDGYADFLVGAAGASANAGAAHLYLGAAVPSAAAWNGATPARRFDLATPDGAGAGFGGAVAGGGDVNGDGHADLLVGVELGGSLGAAHFYLGAATVDVTTWNGASPAGRIDLANPDGARASFGSSVAN